MVITLGCKLCHIHVAAFLAIVLSRGGGQMKFVRGDCTVQHLMCMVVGHTPQRFIMGSRAPPPPNKKRH